MSDHDEASLSQEDLDALDSTNVSSLDIESVKNEQEDEEKERDVSTVLDQADGDSDSSEDFIEDEGKQIEEQESQDDIEEEVELDLRSFVNNVITAEIVGTRLKEEPEQTFTVFRVKISSGNQSYIIERRYSEFLKLRNELSAFFERALTTPFPPKTLWENPRDEEIVSMRKVALQRFLQSCFSHQLIFASRFVLDFLELHKKLKAPQHKGVFVSDYGGPEAAQYGLVPRPVLFSRNEPILVLVQVKAAALTPLDLKIRSGKARLMLPYKLPITLGHDFSGVVLAVGAGVKDFAVGDEVFGRLDDRMTGAMAEHVLVAAPLLAKKPSNLSHEEAATFPTVAMTTYQALVDDAKLSAGQKLFITGAETGLGSFALQYAENILSASVTAVCKPAHLERCEQLGAAKVIKNSDTEAKSTIRDQNVSFDTVGTDDAVWAVAKGGVCVSACGDPTSSALAKHVSLGVPRYVRWMYAASTGLTVVQAKARGVRYSSVVTRSSGEVLRNMCDAIASGQLRPCIDRIYRLEQISDAMQYVESLGHTPGTVVITLGEVEEDQEKDDDNEE